MESSPIFIQPSWEVLAPDSTSKDKITSWFWLKREKIVQNLRNLVYCSIEVGSQAALQICNIKGNYFDPVRSGEGSIC